MSQNFATPSTKTSPAARSVDVLEFAWLNPSEELTQVFHYRTVYTEEGHLHRDVLSREQLVISIIESFSGQLVTQGNRISGSFSDVETASQASRAIANYLTQSVETIGTELSVIL
ncbi:MAG: hypothetical protein RLZZ627_1953 [Pseudomonadota bacterium]|jgi:hypothetical protein